MKYLTFFFYTKSLKADVFLLIAYLNSDIKFSLKILYWDYTKFKMLKVDSHTQITPNMKVFQ